MAMKSVGSELSKDGEDSGNVQTAKSTKSSCEVLQPSISDMKDRVRKNLGAEEEEEEFDLFKLYWDEGFFQKIAKHDIFENCTLLVIALNAIYIAIDTDWSKAETLYAKEPFFIFGEHAFCAYFTFEWVIRFGAFKHKLDGRKSGWFVFDSALVFMMVAETWVIASLSAVTGSGKLPFPTSILRLFRLLRLSRLIRMLKSFPELMILIRGMVSALWAGTYVFALLTLIMYIFAILCVQLGSQDANISEFFANIPLAMYSLFIFATFLDDLAYFMDKIRLADGYTPELLLPFIFIFIALSSMTVMNMLVGVLCEVVSEVADEEKDKIKCDTLKTTMGYVMQELDTNSDGKMTFQEFEKIMGMPKALGALQRVDVDPENIVDFAELFFEVEDGDDNEEEDGGNTTGSENLLVASKLTRALTQDEFTDMILRLRNSETAKVTDILDWQEKITKKMGKNGGALMEVEEGFGGMKSKIDHRNNDVAAKLRECKDLLGLI